MRNVTPKGQARRPLARSARAAIALGLSLGVVVAVACGDARRPLGAWPHGNGGNGNGGEAGAGVCQEGAVQECHYELGHNGSVLSCLWGEQICTDGVWGPCIGNIVDRRLDLPHQEWLEALDVARNEAAAQGADLPFPMALSDAGTCNEPCDPTCKVFDEQPDGAATTQPSTVTLPGGSITSLPGGFQNKMLKDSAHPPYPACDGPEDCQADHYCNTGTGLCTPWGVGQFAACGGADLTVGVPCDHHVPVCNRGDQAVTGDFQIVVMNGNSAQLQNNFGKCSGFEGTVNKSCIVSDDIAPGECIFADCVLPLPMGTKGIAVNSADFAPPDPLAECNCSNNWSAYSLGSWPSCPDADLHSAMYYSEQYTAVCPAGEHPQWGYMAYDATVPCNASGCASVVIEAQTVQSPALIPTDCLECVTVASLPSDPVLCPMAGPSPCPRNLYVLLGVPAAGFDTLEIAFTMVPTPDRLEGVGVNSWEVTYSCVPAE
jgi:hypothetical protein